MKAFSFLVFTFLIHYSLHAQQTSGFIVEVDGTCDCEIMIESVLDPTIPPDIGPTDSSGRIRGDLDSFETMLNGLCYRTVNVSKRKIISNQVQFQTITLANNFNDLLEVYKDYSSICLKGYFSIGNTVKVGDDKILKLLDDTVIAYNGFGVRPAISFEGSNSGIQGGEIRTDVPMNDGLIKIVSNDVQDANSIQIKDIVLTSNHDQNFGTNARAKDDRAIHMSNNFESLITQRDYSTNYHAQIINVDITGFAVGMHLRGWSNAASVRDVRFTDVSSYGIWVSGCVDNSFADLIFNNCQSAHAIRLDNYVDERFSLFKLGGQSISLDDPNERAEIKTEMFLSDLLPLETSVIELTMSDNVNSDEQEAFNDNLDALIANSDEDIATDASLFFAILESCGVTANLEDHTFLNEIDDDNNVTKFGLKGYYDDDVNPFDNYPPDQLNVTRIPNLTGNSDTNISLYKSNFIHPDNANISVTVDPTCIESFGSTMFFRRPTQNIFSNVQIIDENGINQVAAVVEQRGREDDLDLCMENVGTNDPCSNCFYEQTRYDPDTESAKITNRNAMGFANTVYVCSLGTIPDIINNSATDNLPACILTDVILKVVEQ